MRLSVPTVEGFTPAPAVTAAPAPESLPVRAAFFAVTSVTVPAGLAACCAGEAEADCAFSSEAMNLQREVCYGEVNY